MADKLNSNPEDKWLDVLVDAQPMLDLALTLSTSDGNTTMKTDESSSIERISWEGSLLGRLARSVRCANRWIPTSGHVASRLPI